MTAIKSEVKMWTVFDAKIEQLHYLTHEEFKDFILNRPIKLTGKFIRVNGRKTWIDGMINTDWLK